MARKITQKQLKHDEFVEAAFDFGHWLEQHWRIVAQGVVALALVVIGVFSWIAWSQRRVEEAKDRLATAIERYAAAHVGGGEPDAAKLQEALEILDEVAARLGRKPPGRLAAFYRGATLADLGRTDEARSALQALIEQSGPEQTVGATARWLLVQLEVAEGHTDEALALLRDLAERSDAMAAPDQALLEMARIQHDAGSVDEARRHWQRIVDEHPQGAAAAEARNRLR